MNTEWIKSYDELPPEDGYYEVAEYIEEVESDINKTCYVLAYYDGFFFKNYSGYYLYPVFWRRSNVNTKRYGKVVHETQTT